MLRKTKTWDVRCPPALKRMFPRSARRGYYYKVDRQQARRICGIMSRAYGVTVPHVMIDRPPPGWNGAYEWQGRGFGVIWVHGRAHLKSVFHEWYHHLDAATRGRYDSDDRRGGPSSLAWQFADRLFDALRTS
jgi:hypothetical protein